MSIQSGPPVLTAADVSDHWLPLPAWLRSDYAKVGGLTLLAILVGCVGAGVAHLIRSHYR